LKNGNVDKLGEAVSHQNTLFRYSKKRQPVNYQTDKGY
jgi:hypothetical protein